ncbi:MAG: acyl-CoA dehydrogenase [Chloroflexi bacterium]|jgi:alkylation response protein AidB-like acyl-CoA dehydrogenase|nr:acyl-CoA dehydrogenase [Chloroflexota bacterium]
MGFGLNEDQLMLQKNVRAFLEKEIAPLVNEYEEKYAPYPRDILVDLIKKLLPWDYCLGIVKKKDGGTEIPYVSNGVLQEELSRIWPSLAVSLGAGGGYLIGKLATEEQKKKYLPGMQSLDILGSFALTEPNVGSDLRGVETTAVLQGDHYVLNGQKAWVTGGNIAEVAIVFASEDRSKGVDGLGIFLVDRRESPFEATIIPKIGLRCAPSALMTFTDCKVPKANLVAGAGTGAMAKLTGELGFTRATVGIFSVGIAQASIEAGIKYAQQRIQFGRKIGKFQLIQNLIAESVVETEAARLLLYKAFSNLDEGKEATIEACGGKYFANEVALKAASNAMKVHGAWGLAEEYPVERYFRDARAMFPPEGNPEIQKMIVGGRVLGMSALV